MDPIDRYAATRAVAKYLRDMAIIDYPDADPSIKGWMPVARGILVEVPSLPTKILSLEMEDDGK